MSDRQGFSFGRNWQKYLDDLPTGATEAMQAYVAEWLGSDLTGQRLVDIGSGQGLTSLSAFRLGASVVSFDLDPQSVAATRRLRESAGNPASWQVEQGSILDESFVRGLGTFDLVISWGVLHHTGSLWSAVDAAVGLVAPGGRLWIALYHRTRQSGRSLRTKRMYAALPGFGKTVFRGIYAATKIAKSLIVRRRLPALQGAYDARGMNWWRDIEDWLGGLPYEVAGPGEVLARLRPMGFDLVRLDDAISEGRNDVYLFLRSPSQPRVVPLETTRSIRALRSTLHWDGPLTPGPPVSPGPSVSQGHGDGHHPRDDREPVVKPDLGGSQYRDETEDQQRPVARKSEREDEESRTGSPQDRLRHAEADGREQRAVADRSRVPDRDDEVRPGSEAGNGHRDRGRDAEPDGCTDERPLDVDPHREGHPGTRKEFDRGPHSRERHAGIDKAERTGKGGGYPATEDSVPEPRRDKRNP